jgi:hypothetical protein
MPSHKRTFDDFAEPPPPFKWGRPYLHNNNAEGTARRNSDPVKPNMIPFYDHATKGTLDQHVTVRNFIHASI